MVSVASSVAQRVREVVGRLLQLWEAGDMPQAVAAAFIRRKAPQRPCDRWSLGNRLILWLHGTEDARGFRQWQEVGRYVQRGAKAIYILAPITRLVPVGTEVDPATGREVELRTIRVVGFKAVPVFRVEDTGGKPLEIPDYRPPQLPPLFGVARAWGIRVEWAPPDAPGVYGWYSPTLQAIRLHTYDPGTFFHELAHAAHGRIRPLRSGQDPHQEMVAETCAAALALLYGYPGRITYARDYVATYAGAPPGAAARAVLGALHDVETVLELILTTAEQAAGVQADGAA